MALTPRPTAAQVQALRDKEGIGPYEAKGRLFDAWSKENLTHVKVTAATADSIPQLSSALVDLINLIEAAMDEDTK